MKAIDQDEQSTNLEARDLQQMVGPDPHRPGPARARLRAEQIPVWAIVGHVKAVAPPADLSSTTDQVIVQVAADFDIRPEAVRAALLYYRTHAGSIDALLELNAAAVA